jgi:quercetin dioxygenase-like cupin family protein
VDGAEAPSKVHLPSVPGGGGVVWSASPGFHANLVVLDPHGRIEPHRNDEVDVLVVVLDGAGRIEVDAAPVEVAAGDAVVVPSHTTRSLRAGAGGMRYLSVHAQRRGLAVGPRRGGAA